MKNFVKMIAMLGIILSMTGIATARNDGCPNYEAHNIYYNSASIRAVSNGLIETYVLDTESKPEASLIKLCVFPTPEFNGDDNDLHALYPNWAASDSNSIFSYVRTQGDKNNILFDGQKNIHIGDAKFETENLPVSYKFLIHIKDPQECGQKENTCWRRPGINYQPPPPPVPEMPTIALLGIGMFALFMVSRRLK